MDDPWSALQWVFMTQFSINIDTFGRYCIAVIPVGLSLGWGVLQFCLPAPNQPINCLLTNAPANNLYGNKLQLTLCKRT